MPHKAYSRNQLNEMRRYIRRKFPEVCVDNWRANPRDTQTWLPEIEHCLKTCSEKLRHLPRKQASPEDIERFTDAKVCLHIILWGHSMGCFA